MPKKSRDFVTVQLRSFHCIMRKRSLFYLKKKRKGKERILHKTEYSNQNAECLTLPALKLMTADSQATETKKKNNVSTIAY